MEIFNLQQLCLALRILLAGFCGSLIGLERKNRSKEAGVRTHFVVACGAALMMIVSKYAFFDVIGDAALNGEAVKLDPSRVASNIAGGIGFLGAGMIFVHKNTITGLTTAAGIWATSGVGMAIGAGMYVVGACSTVLILVGQYILHLNIKREKISALKYLSIKEISENDFERYIVNELDKKSIVVQDMIIENLGRDSLRNYTLKLEVPQAVSDGDIISDFECKWLVKSYT